MGLSLFAHFQPIRAGRKVDGGWPQKEQLEPSHDLWVLLDQKETALIPQIQEGKRHTARKS